MIRVHPEVSALLRRGDVHGVRGALQAAIELEHAVLGEGALAGKRHHQVTNDLFAGAITVTGVASA